jgi:hypothetical protein
MEMTRQRFNDTQTTYRTTTVKKQSRYPTRCFSSPYIVATINVYYDFTKSGKLQAMPNMNFLGVIQEGQTVFKNLLIGVCSELQAILLGLAASANVS